MDSKEAINLKEFTNIKNINLKTILALLMLIAGILFYISWGIIYGVWADIGIYSITIVLVIPGIIGLFLSILENRTEG